MRQLIASLFAALACGHVWADASRVVAPPPALQVRSVQPPAADTQDLKFRDFFTLPVGPRGLVPSERLLGLANQRVRIVGYMARQEDASPGILIVAPVPVALGDEDERYSDDLPASAVYVHLSQPHRMHTAAWMPGLLAFTGVLRIGAADEADGRISFVRLELDADLSRAVVEAP